jgi:hypothetical protein
MKIRRVFANDRKQRLEMVVFSGESYPLPYARLDPAPTPRSPLVEVRVDRKLGREAVTYLLASGDEGCAHLEQALEHNREPGYMAELLLHELTVEALRRVEGCGSSRRELARRLGTSVPQLYRLLDPTNTTKSMAQLVSLLHVLECDVRLVVKPRRAT